MRLVRLDRRLVAFFLGCLRLLLCASDGSGPDGSAIAAGGSRDGCRAPLSTANGEDGGDCCCQRTSERRERSADKKRNRPSVLQMSRLSSCSYARHLDEHNPNAYAGSGSNIAIGGVGDEWEELYDDASGHPYWFNHATGVRARAPQHPSAA